ncbi:hypothetical protein, partial [Candidatus Kuenenia stuttgartiensis]|uniref:hypothetical protein n=1 Tax=Kuenenia stuttgartiensis TaxID=174633 RepID=UPI00146EEDE4
FVVERDVVKDHCLSFSQAYVKDDTETYRSVSSAIGYTTRTQEIDNRMLAWSTVWRWLRFFGSLKYTLRNAFDLIRQADPNSPVFAKCFPFTTESIKANNEKPPSINRFNCSAPSRNITEFLGIHFSPNWQQKAAGLELHHLHT